MIWKEVSPGIYTTQYMGCTVHKIFQYKNRYGKEVYTYECTYNGKCYNGASWAFIKARILNTTQTSLF